GVNSKWPTAFTPALSSNWAPAFNITPVMMQMKDIGFIVGRNRVFLRSAAKRSGFVASPPLSAGRRPPALQSARRANVSRLRLFNNHPAFVSRDDLHRHVLRQQFVIPVGRYQ